MQPLTAAELERHLDARLNPVLSARRTAAPVAHALAPLARVHQDFTLHWVEVIARTNYEMAYQFAAAAPAAFAVLDADAAEAWIIHAVDTYDRAGLHLGSEVFKNFAAFAGERMQAQAVLYEEVAPVLTLFVCGLSGRRMTLEPAPAAWTDTETLYLPPRIALGATRAENFLIYKIIATLLWAQSRYGTFNADLGAVLRAYTDPARAGSWLNYLETLRLEAQLARVLPGLAREMAALAGTHAEPAAHDTRFAKLRDAGASVHDSIELLGTLPLNEEPPRRAWLGTLHPAEAAATRAARIAREKDALQAALAALLGEQPQADDGSDAAAFELTVERDDNAEIRYELSLGGQPLAPPDAVRNLLDSILHDIEDIADDYLTPAAAPDNADAAQVAANELTGEAAGGEPLYYDEWDYQRRHYRKQWCMLREVEIIAGDGTFVDATLKKYAPQVAQLKRTFEMLRGEDRLFKRQKNGDDVDFDALIAGYADMQTGRELTERLFTRRHKAERNLAALFMVDMSGSTKGWINEAERESLVLLSEALEVLGDRYAIYGFSGITRKRCEIFRIKRFDEPYSDAVRRRIAGIAPQDYTRMGAAIRHLSALLQTVDARTRLLVTLSDGKPDDYSDHYRGEYGIEDTRQALLEAHRAGIKPFCITIDSEARAYLPHMYGAVNWTLVDDVSRLPLKVAEIYRRLTT